MNYIKKIVRVILIVNVLILNLFSPNIVIAQDNLGDIKNDTISVGSLDNEGDILITKKVSKTDKDNEYKVSFSIKGNPYTTLNQYNVDSYTVFVLDASYSMMGNKWNKAKEAAINFSNLLVNNSENNYLALVTFNSVGMQKRDFLNTAFTSDDFGNINFQTNYNQGLLKALDYIDNNYYEDAIYNIVFISDGEPNSEDYTNTLNNIKNKNVNIYSLAYNLSVDSNAYNILKDISTNDTVYETDEDNISDKLSLVATEIIKHNAGTNAKIEDKIGSDFSFKSGGVDVNGNEISYDIGDITEEGVEFDFLIKINDDLDTGWYKTNDGFKLTYKDIDGNTQTLETDDSALVYWISDKVDYNINYYNDNELIKQITKSAKIGTNIELSDDEVNLYKEEGYKLESVNPNLLIISEDNINNIDIVYTKIKDLSYKVEYYYDGVKDDLKTLTYDNIEYGTYTSYEDNNIDGYSQCLVLNDNTKITSNDTIVSVYYCKNNYDYKIKYYYDNNNEFTYTNNTLFSSVIDNYPDREKEGYILDTVINLPLTISSDVGSNIISVFYKLKDINYHINYLDLDGNKIIPSVEKIDKYGTQINEDFKEIKGYNLSSNSNVSIKLTDEDNEINFYYDKKTNNITFKYVDIYGNKISEDDIISGYYDDSYSISVKDIDNYEFVNDYNIFNGKIGDSDEIITFVYKKIDTKEVSAPITGISDKKYISMIFISLVGILFLTLTKKILSIKK